MAVRVRGVAGRVGGAVTTERAHRLKGLYRSPRRHAGRLRPGA